MSTPRNPRRKPRLTVAEALRLVREIKGEPLRLYVPSRSQRGMFHLVDLEEHNFNGMCGCHNWMCRLSPLLREPDWEPGSETRCWHIEVARLYWLEKYIRLMAAKMNGGSR